MDKNRINDNKNGMNDNKNSVYDNKNEIYDNKNRMYDNKNRMCNDTTMEDDTALHIKKTKSIVLAGLLFAMAIILSTVENSLPPIFVSVPGVKLGLSNIAVMFSLFFLSKSSAFMIAVLKAGFVAITRGIIAGLLTLSGGILSILVMSILIILFKDKVSYLIISIFGAISHNIGQLIAISFILTQIYIWVYLPVLLISGILAGIATSVLLKLIQPTFKKIFVLR